MAIEQFMGVPVENLEQIMQTPIENIESIGGEDVVVVGNTGIFSFGYDGSTHGVQLETMNLISGGNALFANTLTCHYGGRRREQRQQCKGNYRRGV